MHEIKLRSSSIGSRCANVTEHSGPTNVSLRNVVLRQLEAGKQLRPTLGDEQFIDVELHRDTNLLPRRNDGEAADWRRVQDRKSGSAKAAEKPLDSGMKIIAGNARQ